MNTRIFGDTRPRSRGFASKAAGSVLLAVMLTSLAGCTKDPPATKPNDGPKKATPVPSDMVLNDFIPPSGSAEITGVKDAGTLGDIPSDPSAAGAGAQEAAAQEAAGQMKVVEPGAEPRAVRSYAFVANRPEKRLLLTRQGAQQPGVGTQEASFALTVELVAKVVKPTGARFEMKVLDIDVPGIPAAQKAQAAAQLAAFRGIGAAFDVSKRGDVSEVDFKADERMQMQGAELVLQSLQSAFELLVAPLPAEPVGVGAKWVRKVEQPQPGGAGGAGAAGAPTTTHTFTLKEATAETATIHVEVEVNVPKHALAQRGAPPGTTEEVSGKGAYTFQVRFDRLATKVEGEMKIVRKLEAPDGRGGKQSESDVVTLKNVIEQVK